MVTPLPGVRVSTEPSKKPITPPKTNKIKAAAIALTSGAPTQTSCPRRIKSAATLNMTTPAGTGNAYQ